MLDKIKEKISGNQKFLLACHNSPDGDAVGSLLALGEFLSSIGKTVSMYCVDKVPYFLEFLEGSKKIKNTLDGLDEVDVFFSIDCAEFHRLGSDPRNQVKIDCVINIDHHISNSNFGDINYVDPKASCTGELVMRILKNWDFKLSQSMAEALYVSVLTDTGSFKYGGTTSEALSMASDLVKVGALPWKISTELYENNPPQKLRLLMEVLQSFYVDESGFFATVEVTKEMLSKNNASPEMTDGFVNYPRAIKGVEVAVLFRELDGKVKLSVRSVGEYNVSDFCSKHSGGGHKNAAGCYVQGTLAKVKKQIISELQVWVKQQFQNQ